MALKSTNQSYLFNTLNKDNTINNLVKDLMTKGANVGNSQIEEQLMVINKRYKLALKRRVMNQYESGRILLKFSPDVKLPTAMPFFLINTNNGISAVISLSTYSYQLQSSDMSIDPKKLYTLLEAAYIAIDYSTNYARYNANTNVNTHGSKIYAGMIFNAINKKFNIGIDKKKSELVLFFSAKFFMINVLGRDLKSLEIINNMAKKLCKTLSNDIIMDKDEEFDLNAYKNINLFIAKLAEVCEITNLNIRNFLETYMQMYGEGTLLGLELFPYFMLNIASAINGAFLNNQYMFETIIEVDGPKLYSAFI